jgi:secondary thiamine-phosphate synthase enzyme
LTLKIEKVVKNSGIQQGVVNIFNVGSTACVGTIEFEPGLGEDLANLLYRLIPPDLDYRHEQAWHDGNAHSHLQATNIGPSVTVPLANSKLLLGTWQQVFHLECDTRARKRTIVVTVMGE